MIDPVFQQGFEEAKARILRHLKEVATETWPPHDPFSYEPQASSPRTGGSVLDDCIRIVESLECPDTRG